MVDKIAITVLGIGGLAVAGMIATIEAAAFGTTESTDVVHKDRCATKGEVHKDLYYYEDRGATKDKGATKDEVHKDRGAINRDLYRNISRGYRKVFRTRLMLVGHLCAGKTSVKRSLMSETFVHDHEPTNGINVQGEITVDTVVNWKKGHLTNNEHLMKEMVRNLRSPSDLARGNMLTPETEHKLEQMKLTSDDVRLYSEDGEDMIFNIWDFGGQHVYYTSHQTFLSSRAIYLLVLDVTKPLDTALETEGEEKRWKDCGEPRMCADVVDFWLNSVHSHLTERQRSDGESSSPCVIIVCTKTDLLPRESRKKKIRDYIRSVEDYVADKIYHQHVHYEILAVSNLKKDGIQKLRDTIVKVAKKEPYWGEERPIRWLLLADSLDKERKSRPQEPVMNYEDVVGLAERLGLEEGEVPEFLNFHHGLGDLVYFNDEGTRDTVILSPQWLGDVFRTVITQDQLLDRHKLPPDQHRKLKRGILFPETARKLCHVTDPQTLVKIMETSDMLIPCGINMDNREEVPVYLVPCLMKRAPGDQVKAKPGSVPGIHFKFAPFEYKDSSELDTMGFLPPGLYHRVMSCCCRMKKWKQYGKSIFYDYIVFGVQDFLFSLRMVHSGITLSAFNIEGDVLGYSGELTEIRETIQSAIEHVTREVFPNLVCIPFLPCICLETRPGIEEPGFIRASYIEESIRVKECTHGDIVNIDPWAVWFGDSEMLQESLARDATQQRHAPVMSEITSQIAFESLPDEIDMLIPVDVVQVSKEEVERRLARDSVYAMNRNPRGRVLIINNVQFADPSKDRTPSVHDVQNLSNVFEKLHFKVVSKEDLTAEDMRKCILKESTGTDHSNYDAFFLIVMSHGTKDYITGTDGKVVPIQKDLVEPFHQDKCKSLFGKPKVFIFQACEGEKLSRGVCNVENVDGGTTLGAGETSHDEGHDFADAAGAGAAEEHEMANILEVSSTVPGYVANKEGKGSWFIRSFVYQLTRSAHCKHLADILIDVRRCVQEQRNVMREMQLPHTRKDTLLKKLYFFPGYHC